MKRWITLLLVLAICSAPLVGGLNALAEELPVEPAEIEQSAEEVEVALGSEEGEAPTGETVVEETPPAAFTPTYVKVLPETLEIFAEPGGMEPVAVLKKDDVILAVEAAESRQKVAFYLSERGVVTGYAAPEALQALTFEELDWYVAAFADNVQALYNDDLNYPLAPLEAAPVGEAQEPTEVESIEAVADAEPTVVENVSKEPTEVVNPEPAAEAAQQAEEPAMNPIQEPASEPAPESQTEPVAEPEVPQEPSAAEPEPASEPQIEPAAEPEAPQEPSAEEPQPAPEGQAEPAAEPEVVSVDEAIAAPAAEPVPEPVPEPDGVNYAVAAPGDPVPPTDFSIPAALFLGVKETVAQLTPAMVPADAVTTFTWSSSKPKIVEVNPATGALLAKKKGSAVITATSANGIQRTCAITVLKAPKSVTLSETKVVLMGGGQSRQLSVTFPKKSAALAYYESSDPNVVVVNGAGLITSVNPGSAVVTVRIFNGKTASCDVRVLDPSVPQPAMIAVPDTISLGVKQVTQLTPIMYSTTGESLGTTEFTVESSAPKKLKVDANGVITAAKKGDYTLTVTAYNGVSAVCKVHVEKAPSKIAITPKEPVLGVGQTRQLSVSFPKGGIGTVTFQSANPGIVAVDAAGYVTGVAEGSAVVTARTHNGKTAKVTVKVTRSPQYVGLNANYALEYDMFTGAYTAMYNVALNPGESYQLSCEVEYGAYGDVAAFESWNNAVATVTPGGLITAVAPGETIVVVRTTGGSETLCRVWVAGAAPAAVWFEPAELTLGIGEVQPVPALVSSTVAPEILATATYASANPGMFTVTYNEANARWELTGVAPGIAYLSAAAGEYTAAMKVTVPPPVPVSTTPTFRLFAAYGYQNPDYKGYLPFTENNARSVASTFGNSSVSGLTYTTYVMGNPTKTGLLNGISSFFAGSTDADVSIVYLCSHGHMTNGIAGYRMSLPGYDDSPNNANYFLTSQEIFNCVSRIRGCVVLIVDSCYSGAFLEDMIGQLDAQGGRIAVMTAASDTRATYYNVKKTEKTVDFFTFFLLKGLGYNHRDKWWNKNAAGKKGAYPGYLAADQAGNQDGIVTVGELYNYAAQSIAANIPSYMKKSWYWGDKTRVQVPRYYAGNLNDLVIYQPR